MRLRPLLLVSVVLAACRQPSGSGEQDSSSGPAESSPVAAALSSLPEVAPPGFAECEEKVVATGREQGHPGTGLVGELRAGILARGKSHPVVFVRAPRRSEDAPTRSIWRRIESAPTPAYALYDAYPSIVSSRKRARAALLREGYLYADDTGLGLALATVVRLEHLFDAPEVYIHRGATVLRATRRKLGESSVYFYEDGPEEGSVAQILLFDRVATSREELERPLHFDLLPLRRALGFEEATVQHVTDDRVVAHLRYEGTWVPTLLSRDGATVSLDCELARRDVAADIARVRAERARREGSIARQREIIYAQLAEGLPFDEPKTEVGQQDGKLRQEWLWAYRRGDTRFEFNDDRYFVFDHQGRPRVPQVCIDFIRDTYERAAGSWYQKRGAPRERLPGAINFRDFELENDRSVESFVAFAESRPEWFDVWHVPDEERVPLIRRPDFYAYLYGHRHDFAPGDIVTILGLRDDGKMHYHSFFVFESDPVTGVPILLAANAGRPRIRSWEGEMRNAPYRSIKTRIRPKLEWLERVMPPDGTTSAAEVPPGAVTPI